MSEFVVKEGVVFGVDLNYLVQTADALINQLPLMKPEHINQTKFDSLTGSALIKNGVATTNNLLLTSSSFITHGKGELDLVMQIINLELLVKSQQTVESQWEIPVLIKGNLFSPAVQLDSRKLQEMLAKQQLEKFKNKAQDEIKKRLPKAGDLLQNLLGR